MLVQIQVGQRMHQNTHFETPKLKIFWGGGTALWVPSSQTPPSLVLLLSCLSLSSLYIYPLNPARAVGSAQCCKLPQWVRAEPGCQTLLVHFQTKIRALFVTCIMTFIIFSRPTVHFDYVQRR